MGHITHLLVYFVSSLSKCVLYEGRNCELFAALKTPGTWWVPSKYLLNELCEWAAWLLGASMVRYWTREHSIECSQYNTFRGP